MDSAKRPQCKTQLIAFSRVSNTNLNVGNDKKGKMKNEELEKLK
jgi:hypothetical protein